MELLSCNSAFTMLVVINPETATLLATILVFSKYESFSRTNSVWFTVVKYESAYPSFVTETPSAGSEFDELHYDGGIYSDSASRYYIGTLPILHVDSKIVDGVTADNNPSNASSVSIWRDRSGNSNDLIQSTASKQMAYDTSTSPNSLVSDGGDFFNLTDEIAFLTSSALTQIFISADLNSGGGNNTFISGLTKSPGLNADLILFAGSTAGSGTELKIAGNHTSHGASVPSTSTSPDISRLVNIEVPGACLLYTSDAADE